MVLVAWCVVTTQTGPKCGMALNWGDMKKMLTCANSDSKYTDCVKAQSDTHERRHRGGHREKEREVGHSVSTIEEHAQEDEAEYCAQSDMSFKLRVCCHDVQLGCTYRRRRHRG